MNLLQAGIFRLTGTRRDGAKFDPHQIVAVWLKASPVLGCDPNLLRKDKCGALIGFLEYGNTNSDLGWEIDHEIPVALGGSDFLNNLQPLHWKNNRLKSDHYPAWSCAVTARV